MFINTIYAGYNLVNTIITVNDIFNPSFDKYKAIQNMLIELGFKEEDNHNYSRNDLVIKFRYTEQDYVNVENYYNNKIKHLLPNNNIYKAFVGDLIEFLIIDSKVSDLETYFKSYNKDTLQWEPEFN